MVDLVLLDRVAQRAHDVLLPDDVGERAGTVAAVERRAGGHGTNQSSGRVRPYLSAVPQRLRSEGVVLVPALLAVALLVYWAAHGGGYAPTTWEPSALVVLGLLVATAIGIGPRRVRLARPAAIALAALAGYVAWSYLSIAWAASPGDALDGANRALLFLLLFALFALLPWSAWSALATLTVYALGIGVLAVVTLARLHTDGAPDLFAEGRLVYPLGYVNGAAALFMIGTVVSIALASRRELPVVLRALLLALGTAACQASVLSESRGWLFALPVVLVLAVVLVPGRVRLVLWALGPLAGTLLALPALLDVFTRVNAAATTPAARSVLLDAAAHASTVALPICVVVGVVGLALALADRRVELSARTVRGVNRVAAGLAILAAFAGVAAGLAASHGRPDRSIARYWDRSHGYHAAAAGSSRFAQAGTNRPDFWRVALDGFAAHPLGGLGQDNYGDYYLRHRRTDEQPRWTHSVELRLLTHTGVVGALLFAAFLVAGLLAALRGRKRAGPLASGAAAIALLPLVVWLVHGSLDWFWEFPALSGPAFAFLGLATAVMRAPAPAEAKPTRRGVVAVAEGLLGAAALAGALALALPYLAEREIAHATQSWRTDPSGALAQLDRARDLNPLSAQPDLVAAVIALQLQRPDIAHARLDGALEREAGNWFIVFVRGLSASAAGDRAEARTDFRRARTLDPREPLVAQALARVDGDRPLTAAEALGQVRRNVQRVTGRS